MAIRIRRVTTLKRGGRGETGAAGDATRTQRTAATTIAKGFALAPSNSAADVSPVASRAMALAVTGIATADAVSAALASYQTSGVVDPTIRSLGAGVPAVAVINETTGAIERDPYYDGSRVSVGTCNELGVISWGSDGHIGTAPRYAMSVKLYGAKGDGVTDDTAAINNAIAAIKRGVAYAEAKFGLYFPPGTYRVDGALLASQIRGLMLQGDGAGSIIKAYGSASTVLLHLQSCYHPYISNLHFRSEVPKTRLVQISTQAGAPGGFISTGACFQSCIFAATNLEIDTCVYIGGGLDANNDFHAFHNCEFANYRENGVVIAASQAYGIQFVNCRIGGFINSALEGQITAGSAILTTSAGRFDSRDVGNWVEVDGAGVGGGLLRAKIVSITDTTHVALDTLATGSMGPNALIRFGSQVGIRCASTEGETTENGGQFRFIGGSMAAHLDADVLLGGGNSGICCCEGTSFELSRRLIRTLGPSADTQKGMTFRDIRFSGDFVDPNYPDAVVWLFGGTLGFYQSKIGDPGAGHTIRFACTNVGAGLSGATKRSFVLEDCDIDSTINPNILFSGEAPTRISNVRQFSYAAEPVLHGNKGKYAGNLSGAFTLNWGHSHMITGYLASTTTFTIDKAPIGLVDEVTLFIQHVTGTGLITWTNTVLWPQSTGAPTVASNGRYDIIRLRYDGNNFWGRWERY
jgi:hypothetical protein